MSSYSTDSRMAPEKRRRSAQVLDFAVLAKARAASADRGLTEGLAQSLALTTMAYL